MGRDEQIEEREVLDSIFPDEITDISENSYRVSITLDIPREDDDDTEPPIIILLSVTYPEAYPSTAPTLDLTSPPNSPKHALFDLSSSKPTLLSLLPPLIHDSLGTAMIFTLIQAVKEGAEALVAERIAAAERVVDDRRREEEAAEEAKFMGEKVTRERFAEWRERFRAVMKEEEEERKRIREEKDGGGAGGKKGGGGGGGGGAGEKMTGRELWEKGLVGKGEEDLGEDEAGPAAPVGD